MLIGNATPRRVLPTTKHVEKLFASNYLEIKTIAADAAV